MVFFNLFQKFKNNYIIPVVVVVVVVVEHRYYKLSHQLSHLTTVFHIHLAMATKPLQLIKPSFTSYRYYDIIFSCIFVDMDDVI